MLFAKRDNLRMPMGLVGVMLAFMASTANALPVTLLAHVQRSANGTFGTLKWSACAPTAANNPCISTTNAWVLANVTPSTAAWDWDPAAGVLTATGVFQTTSHFSSNANGPSIISDKVVDLVIDTTSNKTTAANYQCVEGTYLPGFGAHGCAGLNTGDNATYESAVTYNVGGDASCIQRVINGDDISTGNPRGLTSTSATSGCSATTGAFDLWTVAVYTGPGGQLIVSNGVPLSDPGTNYLSFSVAVVPIPAAVWLFGSALAGLGMVSLWRWAA